MLFEIEAPNKTCPHALLAPKSDHVVVQSNSAGD
jgi:hypothetical protein